MSKPRRQEVDYFPHYCEHGKTLFILESNFKNDGYAVFYKIQELLAKTNGHCYDCSTTEGWEYLLSKMNTSESVVVGIIEKLISMGTFDSKLWESKHIWMQSFVDSIADVYSRRTVELPSKPDIVVSRNPLSETSVNIPPTDKEVNGITVNICPQSKVKDSIVKETIVKESIYSEVLKYLNQTLDSKFRDTKTFKSLINARTKEGATLDDFKTVIDKKYSSWKNTEWQKFLRPQTLFGTNFDSYLNEKEIKKKSQNFFLDKYKEEYENDKERNDEDPVNFECDISDTIYET